MDWLIFPILERIDVKMSFSSEVKRDLSKINRFDKEIFRAELMGYFLSGNMLKKENYFEFVTENEFNIEHFYKILFNLKIDYEPEIRGKFYIAQMKCKDVQELNCSYKTVKGELQKNMIKGAFLGAGSVNNPEKNYHLEMIFQEEKKCDFLNGLCQEYEIHFKKIKVNEKYQLYLKEAEEISRFLALIGANQAVLKFEDVRVMKEMKNKINRKVNCETANLNKTVEAAIRQMEDIHFIKKMNRFNKLPTDLQNIANLRLENPDLSLNDLGQLTEPKIGKSTVNRKLKKIHEFAEDLR